ncbi:MAG: DNA cytosine methyltransferase [Bacilli bacterium]|nr:DNA cytosine methyltransferase [Bacilli bacterium]
MGINNTLPRFLLLENVKNIVSKRFMPLFQKWIDYLSSLGYKSFYKVTSNCLYKTCRYPKRRPYI